MQAIEVELADDVEVRLRLERAAIDTEVEAEIQQRVRLGQRAVERVHDSAEDAVLTQDPDEVDVGIARPSVEEQWQVEALGELELRRKVSTRVRQCECAPWTNLSCVALSACCSRS